MFQVTEKAVEKITEFLKDREDAKIIRILMMEGCCAGPSLGMALDEPKKDDTTFQEGAITFLIHKDLFELAKPIEVDYLDTGMESGFKLTSSLDSCKACGSSCSC